MRSRVLGVFAAVGRSRPAAFLFPMLLPALGIALSSAFLLAGPPPARAVVEREAVLAVVGELKITAGMLEDEMARRSAGGGPPASREQVLAEMVDTEVLAQAALRAGYDRDPAFQRYVREMMARRYERETLAPRLQGLAVTDQEVEAFWLANQAEFATPRQVRGAVIRLSVSPKAPEAQRQEAAARAAKVLEEATAQGAGADRFGLLAASHSDDQATRYRGGDTGWLTEGGTDPRMPGEVSAALFALAAPGDLAPLVTTPGAFYVVRLAEERKAGTRPLEQVREAIRHRLLRERRQAAMEAFKEEARRGTKVEMDTELLKKLDREGRGESAGDAPPPLPAGRH